LGAAILPVLAQHFIGVLGWRNAYLALGVTGIVVGLPAAMLATRNARGPLIRSTGAAVPVLPLMRTRAFILICVIFFLLGTAGTGVLGHLVPMMTDYGFSAAKAARFAGLVGLSTLVSRGTIGWLLDRVNAAYMVATIASVCAGMCLLLAHGGSTPVYVIVCILLGLIAGAEVDFISFLVRRYYGAAAFGRMYGFAFAAFVLGPGAALIGYSFDHFHTYRPGLLLFAGLSVLGGALAFALPDYTDPSYAQPIEQL
jgi:cyanate permease